LLNTLDFFSKPDGKCTHYFLRYANKVKNNFYLVDLLYEIILFFHVILGYLENY